MLPGTRCLGGAVLFVILACLGLFAFTGWQAKGNPQAVGWQAVTPTPGPSVPIEAFNHALDAQRDVARYGFEAVGAVAVSNAAVEVSNNCLVGIGLLALGMVILGLPILAGGRKLE